jgi:hypothetical protein
MILIFMFWGSEDGAGENPKNARIVQIETPVLRPSRAGGKGAARAEAPPAKAPERPAPPAPADPAPAEQPGEVLTEAEILERYLEGDVGGALASAQRSGMRSLAASFGKFQSAYEAAQRAFSARETAAALSQFQTALELDRGIAKGKGKYAVTIGRHLSSLHTQNGMEQLDDGREAEARRAFQAALELDPENTRAKAQLEKLAQVAKPAPRPARRPQASASRSRPAPSPPKESSAADEIDAAFDDE